MVQVHHASLSIFPLFRRSTGRFAAFSRALQACAQKHAHFVLDVRRLQSRKYQEYRRFLEGPVGALSNCA